MFVVFPEPLVPEPLVWVLRFLFLLLLLLLLLPLYSTCTSTGTPNYLHLLLPLLLVLLLVRILVLLRAPTSPTYPLLLVLLLELLSMEIPIYGRHVPARRVLVTSMEVPLYVCRLPDLCPPVPICDRVGSSSSTATTNL